jgi:hypothetical protein
VYIILYRTVVMWNMRQNTGLGRTELLPLSVATWLAINFRNVNYCTCSVPLEGWQ